MARFLWSLAEARHAPASLRTLDTLLRRCGLWTRSCVAENRIQHRTKLIYKNDGISSINIHG